MADNTLSQILAQRTSVQQEVVNVDEPTVKLVIFELGDALFAFHGERIREILAQAEVFFLPGCPPSLEGVINVRGDIESVLRLHDLLHQPISGTSSAILLGRAAGMSSGIRVDRVVDVVDISQGAIQAPPATLPEHMRAVVTGVLQFRGQPVAVLDLERIFTDFAGGLR